MFGFVAARSTSARELLTDAPRSLRELSREHADGWGIAIANDHDWRVHRSTACAARCDNYAALASTEARLVIAHVRKKTVGELSLANTHPFQRGRFVFAHNGTCQVEPLLARTAAEHLARIEGSTDSEKLFAFVLTHIDAAGEVERGVTAAVRALHALGDIGSATFLLSCGSRLYAHRLGRSLFVLAGEVATIVASEPIMDGAWREVSERSLVVLEAPTPSALAA